MNIPHAFKDRKELAELTGSMRQLARVRRTILDDGKGRGCRLAEFDNGTGLAFTVNCDKALDINEFSYRGIPLVWQSKAGVVHPAFYDKEGLGWLRNFSGGLMCTCGLRNAGGPNTYNGENLGLHGRFSNIPAENVNTFETWQDGRFALVITGTIRESAALSENLRVDRQITTYFGDNTIYIDDTITNEGFAPSQFMMLYHMNFAYPLVAPGALIEAPNSTVTPLTDVAAKGLATHSRMDDPQDDYPEQVFIHNVPADNSGLSRVVLKNAALGIGVALSYNLPNLVEWKQMSKGEYVLGLEPANCYPQGCSKNAEDNRLKILAPGESVRHHIEVKPFDI